MLRMSLGLLTKPTRSDGRTRKKVDRREDQSDREHESDLVDDQHDGADGDDRDRQPASVLPITLDAQPQKNGRVNRREARDGADG
ncbi:hypothetical protein OMP38_14140 [Cohnella ginsengisoli]|uniref:Uncharacterized protein n=1 Tax=Cohnella ginsengisoli TaxID=425004 RepID=A0A9X4KH66_9BACL|nr:hypothetical protein [Cohnella ginsengisoli]MDG0791876.1 hypothetical protein [Cohnella ginsengisoli]